MLDRKGSPRPDNKSRALDHHHGERERHHPNLALANFSSLLLGFIDQYAFSQLVIYESCAHMEQRRELKPYESLCEIRQILSKHLLVAVPSDGGLSLQQNIHHVSTPTSAPSPMTTTLQEPTISLWAQYLDHEPVYLSIRSNALLFHLKMVFIESINSPLAKCSPGMIHVRGQSGKLLEANIPVQAILKENHYKSPLLFHTSLSFSSSSTTASSSSSFSHHLGSNTTTSLADLPVSTPGNSVFNPQSAASKIPTRPPPTQFPPSGTALSSSSRKIEQKQLQGGISGHHRTAIIAHSREKVVDEDLEEGEISTSAQSVLRQRSSNPTQSTVMTVPTRKLVQTPTPSTTAAPSPKMTATGSLAQQHVQIGEVVCKLNNVAEMVDSNKSVLVDSTPPEVTKNSSATIASSSPGSANTTAASSSVSIGTAVAEKKPAVSIRTATPAALIPRRPVVTRKPVSSSPMHPAPPSNTPASSTGSAVVSKWPSVPRTPATPLAKQPVRPSPQVAPTPDPLVASSSMLPPSIKIMKRPLVKSNTTSSPAPVTPGPPVPDNAVSTTPAAAVSRSEEAAAQQQSVQSATTTTGNPSINVNASPATLPSTTTQNPKAQPSSSPAVTGGTTQPKWKSPAAALVKPHQTIPKRPVVASQKASVVPPSPLKPSTAAQHQSTHSVDPIQVPKPAADVPKSSASTFVKAVAETTNAAAPSPVTPANPSSSSKLASAKSSERKRPAPSSSAESSDKGGGASGRKKKLIKQATVNHNSPPLEGFLPTPNFVFSFRPFLNVGSMVEKYQPTIQSEGTKGVIRVESAYQSITAMPVYSDQSIEVCFLTFFKISSFFNLLIPNLFVGVALARLSGM